MVFPWFSSATPSFSAFQRYAFDLKTADHKALHRKAILTRDRQPGGLTQNYAPSEMSTQEVLDGFESSFG